jgi:mRNA interferase MazF
LSSEDSPCLVFSIQAEDTDCALTTVIIYTTSVRSTRFEVLLNVRFLKQGAFAVQNIISISPAKFIRKPSSLTDEHRERVEDTVKLWLDLH